MMMNPKPAFYAGLSLVILSLVLWFPSYQLMLIVNPAAVMTSDGITHPTMPLPQLIESALVSVVIAALVAVIVFRRASRSK